MVHGGLHSFRLRAMKVRGLAGRVGLALVMGALASCKEPELPPQPAPPHEEPGPVATQPPPAQTSKPEAPPPPKSGTRVMLANRANDDTWDKMLVAGGRLWVLTNVTRWTNGPMYVPAARLWSVPIAGGQLEKHLDLEGISSLAADDTSLYVAVSRDLSKPNGPTGRVVRIPLAGGSPSDVITGIAPSTMAVDRDGLWIDDKRVGKDGKAEAAGTKGAMAFAFDDESVYFTTPKGAGPSGDSSGARVFRVSKKGGAPKMLAAKLPDEAAGLAVDSTHVYFCAVSWSSPSAEQAGIVARVPKAGGDVEILAKDQPAVRRAWVDDTNVYVLSGRGGHRASVLAIPKTGGEPKTVAVDDTLEHATMDASSVFFSSDGAFDANHKRVAPASLVRIVK